MDADKMDALGGFIRESFAQAKAHHENSVFASPWRYPAPSQGVPDGKIEIPDYPGWHPACVSKDRGSTDYRALYMELADAVIGEVFTVFEDIDECWHVMRRDEDGKVSTALNGVLMKTANMLQGCKENQRRFGDNW